MRPWTSIEGGEHSNVLVTKHTFNSEFVCHGNRRFGLLKGVYTQYHGTEDDFEAR